MKIVDFLLEDHRKRSFFIVMVFSVLVIIELYNTWLLGFHMGSCDEIMDLLKLTSIPAVSKSLAGRLVINYLDFHATESGFKIALRSMSLLNWLMIITALILTTEKSEFRLIILQAAGLAVTWAFLTVMIALSAASTNAQMVADRLAVLSTGLKLLSAGIIVLIVFADVYNGIVHYWNKES